MIRVQQTFTAAVTDNPPNDGWSDHTPNARSSRSLFRRPEHRKWNTGTHRTTPHPEGGRNATPRRGRDA
ncbi:hypothetical protein BV898_19983, partial [Hypsibius exemplaris]